MEASLAEYLKNQVQHFDRISFLVAVSGGRDSMAMLFAMHRLELRMACCHVHFGLRPEAIQEKELVHNFCRQLDIPFYTQSVNTRKYQEEHQLSIQEAARELRYRWFSELMERHRFDYLVTAHHQDDEVETWLINAVRGSGWRGMMGIPSRRDRILRPLLKVTRKAINAYVEKNAIPYLEDLSNLGDQYLRNRFRHHLLPMIDDLLDGRISRLPQTIHNLHDAGVLMNYFLGKLQERVWTSTNGFMTLHVDSISHFPSPGYVLGELLHPYGFSFSRCASMYESLVSDQSGAEYSSKTHEVLVDRRRLLLRALTKAGSEESFQITATDLPLHKNTRIGQLDVFLVAENQYFDDNCLTIYFNPSAIAWPLTWRRWEAGDRIQSFGMKGQSHRIQDLLTDAKLSKWAKESTWVLCDQKEVIWIPGLRMAEKGRIEPGSSCVCLSLRPIVS
ncbi:MAG: tRNA lysidine(34) synthetase TilS [Saprospiraceae bacterium]|nr:tRNA lysidine(34) synthetase TilS [Saprospiraceae bacterium]